MNQVLRMFENENNCGKKIKLISTKKLISENLR